LDCSSQKWVINISTIRVKVLSKLGVAEQGHARMQRKFVGSAFPKKEIVETKKLN
jgi:hypothetical protein